MSEDEPENSLPIESHRIVIPNEISTPPSTDEMKKKRRRRRCMLCCACTSVVIVIIGVILLILFLTVFKLKNPKIDLNNVTFKGLEGVYAYNLSPNTNLTIITDVSVKNPNIASFHFKNSTTQVYYEKVHIVEAEIPEGKAKAKKTTHINVTMDFMMQKILSVPELLGDLLAGSMPLDTKTSIKGRVEILGIIKKTVRVKTDCSLIFIIANQTVQDKKCYSSFNL